MTKEVKARLTLEDGASATVKKLAGGFTELVSGEKLAQGGMDVLKQSLATMAGVYLPQLTRQALEFGQSFVTAAAKGYDDDAAVAALVSTVQGISYDDAIAGARAYGDELDAVAIKSGVNSQQIGEGFQRLLEINSASAAGVARSRDEVAQLATIADKLHVPFETVSVEVGMMGEGMLRAKGRMAQLLQATGVFGNGPLKKVAQGWMQLTDEKRGEILAAGLERASSKMGDMPKTFNSLLGSLANIAQISKEHLGEPLVDALQPELEKLVNFLDNNRAAVERFAQSMAKDVQHWAQEGAAEVKEGWEFLQTHSKEISDAIAEGAHDLKAVVMFILEHKEALALAFGAKTLGPSVLSAAKPIIGGLGSVYSAGAAGIGADGLGAAKLSGAAGGVAALGAFALAIGAATLAVDQFQKATSENAFTSDDRLNYEAIQKRLQEMLNNPDQGVWDQAAIQNFDHMRKSLVDLAGSVGESSAVAGQLADAAYAAHQGVRAMLQPLDDVAHSLEQMDQNGADAMESSKAGVDVLANVFSQAMAAGDAGTQAYVANLLAKSQALQTAFLVSSDMTAGGFDALAELVKGQAEGFADKLKQKADFAPGGAKPDVPKVQFNGGQTFKVQQDFRDEDPDRIALVFQKGILDSAEKRLQASTSTPFGA